MNMPEPGRIDKVIFFKRDELTTDLICCEVLADQQSWLFNEEVKEWDALLDRLSALPGFPADWHASVSQPPFALNTTVAFDRRS